MATLQPAGFWGQLWSWFAPVPVSVQVRTETLENGQIQLTPVFLVDGKEVPGELVGPDAHQRVLGYSVTLDSNAIKVHQQTQGKQTRVAKRKAAEFLQKLEKLGVPVRSKNGKARPRIEVVRPETSLDLHPDDSLAVTSDLITADGVLLDKPENLDQLREDDGWYTVDQDLVRVETTGTPLDEVVIARDGNGVLSGDEVPEFLKLLQQNSKRFASIEKNKPLQDLRVYSGPAEKQLKIDGDADSISLATSLAFAGTQGKKYQQNDAELQQLAERGGGFSRIPQGWIDVSQEDLNQYRTACAELLEKLGKFEEIRGTAIPATLSTLADAGKRDGVLTTPWAVYYSEAVENAHRVVDTPAQVDFSMNIVESDGRSLLSLDPIYNHDRFKLSHSEVEQLSKSGEEWIRRRNAWVKVDQEKFKKILAGAQILKLDYGPDGFTFPASQRERVVSLFSVLGSIQHSQAYAEFLLKLQDFEKIEDTPLPQTLRPEISFRPYQKHGYNWLAFLHRFGLNGILADDMGLGKTLQTLAVIQRAKELSHSKFPSLIICPTSVVNNWKSEVQKFFRDSYVLVYTGARREGKLHHLHELLELSDYGLSGPIVLTSYDVARIDHEKLNRIPWLYVVVDEGHNIKNPDAQRTKAIKTINGQHKLALTGTPIQNKIDELWSLFDYAMPGFLGTRTEFGRRYTRNGKPDPDAILSGSPTLPEKIHPFVMRRLKEDVAKDLPPKIVIDQQVELTPLQVKLYKEVLDTPEYQRLLEKVDKDGVERSAPQILAQLTRLRAICNHPVLAQDDSVSENLRPEDSAKLECLRELIEEIVDGEHRALLFSQSTQMLDIIEQFFGKWQIRCLRLDGATPQNRRMMMVDEYNGDPSIQCFLISTKAGGTGLNLTGADTVIFYDHDWNPANDNQAQDRAYRIGQTRPVTVYRLISKGTIEEKMLERQAKKQTVADMIIGADEDGFKDLTKEELLSLFVLDDVDD